MRPALRRGVPLALAALALAALPGCGDEESPTNSAEAITTDSATTVTETETTTATGGGEQPPVGGDGAAPPADLEVTELTGFSSPSGNIGCYIDRESVRCDIAERDWEPPPAPPDCDLDYGQGMRLTAGSTAELVCAGDTALGGGTTLPYGSSIAAGLLRCESSRAGITCRDIESGRGFSIARESYELF
jgi:hypothetical protein